MIIWVSVLIIFVVIVLFIIGSVLYEVWLRVFCMFVFVLFYCFGGWFLVLNLFNYYGWLVFCCIFLIVKGEKVCFLLIYLYCFCFLQRLFCFYDDMSYVYDVDILLQVFLLVYYFMEDVVVVNVFVGCFYCEVFFVRYVVFFCFCCMFFI